MDREHGRHRSGGVCAEARFRALEESRLMRSLIGEVFEGKSGSSEYLRHRLVESEGWYETLATCRAGDALFLEARGSARVSQSRHRIHSAGDYKNPPPKDEHAGLKRYHDKRSNQPVEFEINVRVLVARELITKMRSLKFRIIAGAVAFKHTHILVELPDDYPGVKKIIGQCKQKASHAVRFILPGNIWAAGGKFNRIKDLSHLRNSMITFGQDKNPEQLSGHITLMKIGLTIPKLAFVVMSRNKTHRRIFQAGV